MTYIGSLISTLGLIKEILVNLNKNDKDFESKISDILDLIDKLKI